MPSVLILYLVAALGVEPAKVDFSQDIQPIFKKHCFACHCETSSKNGLRLDLKTHALAGGESGKVIIPGNANASILFRNIAALPNARAMPPKGVRLSSKEIELIKTWINQGAKWPDDGSEKSNPLAWWSLQPLTQHPAPLANSSWINNPIDSFILAKLQQKQLAPSPLASKQTLIRRLYFNILGLPPKPQDVDAFLNDTRSNAYELLVDRLLASPNYGERWARHWLDAVHFGETHGYDKDKLRLNAWPYRDYVIRSLNSDKPYGRFVAEQIAGDILYPGNPEAIQALGFIASGPWDFIGHAEVPESKIDGRVARHLDRDDMISNTSNTFLSLTVQCAQCHNHKFDPITQADYYSMQAVFSALDRADKPYHADPLIAEQFVKLQSQINATEKQIQTLEANLPGKKELAELDAQIKKLQQPAQGKNPAFGYHSAISNNQSVNKWVGVELKDAANIDKIVLHACHDEFNNIGAGFGFPVRYKVEISDDSSFKNAVILNLSDADKDQVNPGLTPVVIPAGNKKLATFA